MFNFASSGHGGYKNTKVLKGTSFSDDYSHKLLYAGKENSLFSTLL